VSTAKLWEHDSFKRLLFTLFIIFSFTVPKLTTGQATCSTALSLGSSGGDTAHFSGSSVWVQFVSSGTSHRVKVGVSGAETPELEVKFYSGVCGSLTLVDGPEQMPENFNYIDLIYSGLVSGTTYYLELNPSSSGKTYLSSSTPPPSPCNCLNSPAPCQKVCNGDFEDFLTGFNSWDIERACPWQRVLDPSTNGATATPDHWNVSGIGSNLDGCIGLISGINTTGSFQFQEYAFNELESPIANGETAIVSYYIKRADTWPGPMGQDFMYTVDHFAGVLTPTALSQNQLNAILPPTSSIEVDYNGALPGSWTQVVEIVTNSTGTDLNYITFGTFEDNSTLNYSQINSTGSIEAYTLIDEVSVLHLEDCEGPVQACIGDGVTLGNADLNFPGFTYQWLAPSGGIVSGAFSSTLTIGAASLANQGIYTLQISDGTNTYSLEYELIAVDCCTKAATIEVPVSNNTSSYLISALNGGNSIVTSPTVRINGHFVVDESITFSGPEILMGTDAKITVEPGKTIIINNFSELKPCDTEMYEGIIANRQDETIVFRSSTAIGGKNALVSFNNASLTVVASTFEDNYIGIGVYDYQPTTIPYTPSQIDIHGNSFIHSGNNLRPPHSSESFPYKCIDVREVNELVIGGQNLNLFEDYKFGIYASTSEIDIVNATFNQNIPLGIINTDPGTASIYCIGPTGALDFFERAICRISDNHGSVTFNDNQFAVFAREYSLYCDNAVFNGNGYDIRMRDFDGARIWKNEMNGTNGTSIISVSVQNVTPRLADLEVYDNMISSYLKGIEFFNVLGNGGSFETKVYGNNIEFTSTSSSFRQGITSLGSTYSEIYDNTIEKTFGVVSLESNRLVGIRLEQATNAEVYENQISEMGRAILGRGNLSNSQLWCNTMNRYYEGWFFDNASIANQLNTGAVQENKWMNPINAQRDITGTATTNPNLIRNSGAFLNPDQQSGGGSPSIFNEVVVAGVPPCAGGGGGTPSQMSANGGSISGMTSALPNFVPVQLTNNDLSYNNILQAQVNEDLGYMAALSNTAIPLAEASKGQLYSKIQNDGIDSLDQNSIILATDTGKFFMNTEFIIDAYRDFYSKGIEFPVDVKNDLYDIAFSGSPAVYGPDVISAWVMLGLDGQIESDPKSNVFSDSRIDRVLLYPNPTQGRIVFDGTEVFSELDQSISIKVLDLYGRVVYEENTVFSGKSYGLYLNDFPAGVYQVALQYNDKEEMHSILIH